MCPGRRPARCAVFIVALLLMSAVTGSAVAGAAVSGAAVSGDWNVYVGPPRPVSAVKPVGGLPSGCLDFDIRPASTRVFIDGKLVGTVGEYDGWPDKLYLPEGRYRLRLNGPRGLAWRGQVRVLAHHQRSIRLYAN